MAYKSRVTNQYMGASFAGQVNAADSSDALELIKVLQKDVNPTLTKIYNKGIELQQDDAKNKVNQLLLSGKNADTINEEILSGKHPDLTDRYVNKIVQFQLGKAGAVDAITNIEANKEKYDFRTTNLPAFYKEYLPNFVNKDGSYALGFASVFNEFKAKDAIKDAELRSKDSEEKTLSHFSKITFNSDTPEGVWKNISATQSQTIVPPDASLGETKPRQILNNERANNVAIWGARDLYNKATTVKEIDKALGVLYYDRGKTKDGTNLGSLADTNRKDVSDLIRNLNTKRTILENQQRADTENKRKEEIRGIFAEASKEVGVYDDDTVRPRTHAENLQLRNTLSTYGNPELLTAFDTMIDNNRYINTDPTVFTQIVSNIYEGRYENQTDLFRALKDGNVSKKLWAESLSYFSSWKNDSNNGIRPVYATDYTYSNSINAIIGSVKGNFNVGIAGMEKPNSGEAVRNASFYMRKEIIDFERRFKLENRRAPTTFEKDEFMQKLGNVVKQYFTPDTVQPIMKSYTSYEEEQKIKLEQEQRKTELYQSKGVNTFVSTLNKAIETDKGIVKLPMPDLSMFGKDTSWFSLNAADKERYLNQTQIPFIANWIKQKLGEIQFTPDMMKTMTQQDYNSLLKNILSLFPQLAASSDKPATTQIDKALKSIMTGNK